MAFSPCLFYGFKELEKKCRAADSEILCVEADSTLHSFASQEIKRQDLAAPLLALDKNTPAGLEEFFSKAKQKFRRVIRIDLSAGASLYPDFYKNFYECAQNIVAVFWKNRLTLVRLGRLYSKNIFKNLPLSASSAQFEALEGTVEKPILVCGAGESLDELTKFASGNCKQGIALQQGQKGAATKTDTACKTEKAAALAAINERFFILAVDAAVPALLSTGITIDAVAATESQWAIEKAYIGLKDQESGPFFFFDLTSRNQIARRFSKKRAFYFSQFEKNNFLDRLAQKGLLPKIAPPLGSIGLTATYLALLLRKDQSVPICVLGLDFSFSAGRTHALESAQSKALCANSNRLSSSSNFAAAFGPGSQQVLDKNKKPVWTSKNLLGYAALFADYFKGAQKLFDLGKSGLDLGLERKNLFDFLQDRNPNQQQEWPPRSLALEKNGRGRSESCEAFLRAELSALRSLSDLLSKGEDSSARDKSIALDEQILRELRGREYLYLHFPDGTNASLEFNFLTRVKSQIDFFAKDIETALAAGSFIAVRQY